MTDGLRVQVLGPVLVAAGDEVLTVRRPLERALLVRLALARGVGVPDERLAADLWDGEDDESRTARLRVVVSRLRRTLGGAAGAVVRAGDGYRLTADVTDLREAGAAADRVHAAVRAGDHLAARAAAAEALGAWRGPALADLRAVPFARAEGERLDAWRLELSVHRLTAELALGAGADVVAELTELAARNPLHEPLRGMLAVALYRSGRQADALAEIAGLRRALADELGVDPTADTTDLEVRLLRQDPALRAAVTAAPRPAAPSVPTDIRPALADGVVGRRPELVVLAARLDDAMAGRPGVVLVEGGPGTGRTRLLEALGRLADQHGAVVCRGRARAAGGAPAFWPWRQALRQWTQRVAPETAAVVTAGTGPPLARIVPELAPRGETPAALERATADPDDRFGLFEHVMTFLDDAAAAGPGLVLLLDDLHLADVASLLLLAHVAGGASGSRFLVAASMRPAELGDDRAEARADLVRQPATTRLELGGLSPDAVAELLGLVLDRPADPELAAEVARRTGGNPLFVTEIGRAMAAGVDGVPAAVRDAVRSRLDALTSRCRRVLAAAAVLASEIDADVVAAAVDEPLADVLDDLDAAARAGFVVGTDRPRFAHEIVREAVVSDVGTGERARMHLRAAELLESAGAGEHRTAHHRLAALPLGDRERAVRAVTSAADLALRQFAFEDAVALYDRGLGAGPAPDLAARADLLLRKARAQYLSHDVAGAIRSCEEAAALAGHRDDTALLARVATALPDVGDPLWLTTVRRWCRTALAALPPDDGPTRAQLMAQLAAASSWDDDGVGDLQTDSAAALATAERVGDTTALFTALRARQLARSGPEGTHERLGLGTRMLGLAHAAGDPAELWGRLWRFDAFVQLGRIDEADEELDLLEPVVARMRQPLPRWHLIRSRGALLSGRGMFAEARAAADEAVRTAERGRHRAAEYPAHFLRLSVALLTGDPIDEGIFDVERYQPPPRILSMLAAQWHATHGDRSEAERIHSRLPRPETVELLPFMPIPFHAVGGSLAALVGDTAAAEHAYRALLPHADLHVAVGAGASSTGGSIQLVLGTTAAALGRTDTAVDHLRAAVAANTASGLTPYATLARARLADQLRARSGPGDAEEAAALRGEAEATAARLGMRGWSPR